MKKYIVTSYIPNADIDVKFYNSLVVMSRDVGAEIIVADCKANYVNDPSSLLQYAIDEELKDVVVKGSFKFNNKLSLTDYRQSINVIDPISGMAIDSAASALGNMIVAFPRHRFKSVARSLKHSKSPRGVWCTGTISEPYYKDTKSGAAMKNYHVKGALIVEVVDNHLFNIRQLQWDGKGFYDLDTYYTHKKAKKVKDSMIGLSLGDLHPPFVNHDILNSTCDLIKKYKPSNIIVHDTFDATSISHHVANKHLTKSLINNKLSNLEDEIRLTAKVLQVISDAGKKSKVHIVKSNHDEHLEKYLDEFRFKEDYINIQMALVLAGRYIMYKKKLSDKMVLEYALKSYEKLSNVSFYTRDDKLSLAGYEVLNHGDFGANGARGNAKGAGVAFSGKVVTGHTHSPEISAFGNSVNGTMTNLSVSYTNDSGTSGWLNTHTIIYKNGTISHYHIILN